MSKFPTALFLMMGILWTTVCLAQNDQVFLKKTGAPTRGLITAVGRDKVTIQTTGITREIEVKDILKVTFDEEPSELTTARTRALGGQLEDAIEELGKIDATGITNDVIKQDVDYYKAYAAAKHALASGGDKKAPGEQLFTFVSAYPTSFHFYEAAELLGCLSERNPKSFVTIVRCCSGERRCLQGGLVIATGRCVVQNGLQDLSGNPPAQSLFNSR